MIFRFRVCRDGNLADSAQGWVVAGSEIQARVLVGDDAFFQRFSVEEQVEIPDGTVILTCGCLDLGA